MKDDEFWMKEALNLAKTAEQYGEVPIGAIVVIDNQIIGTGFNSKEALHDPTAHAEVIAIRNASQKIKNWRLKKSTLYTTLEPCPMCFGASLQARVDRIVYAAQDLRWGAIETKIKMPEAATFNHSIEVLGGVQAEESQTLLKNFFSQLRESKNKA